MARKRGSSASGRRAWFGSVSSGVAASLVVAALSTIGTFATGWLKVEKTAEGGIRVVRGNAPPAEPPTAAPAIRLSSEGDRPETTRLAADIEPLIRQRLQGHGNIEGLAIRYRLANLAFAGGANRRAAASWAIGLPGKAGAACPAHEISFHSTPNLAERLAQQINGSIAATERRGESTCG